MDLTDWKLLKEIYQQKGLSKAAAALFLSQPAASYRLGKMEKEFGKALFIREYSGIRLTPAGMRLLSFSEKMIALQKEIVENVQQPEASCEGTIRLGTTVTFLQYYLVNQLKPFCDTFPLVNVDVELQSSLELSRMMLNGSLKCAFIQRNEPIRNWAGTVYPILSEPIAVISRHPITEHNLRKSPLIHYYKDAPVNRLIYEWMKLHDITPQYSSIQPSSNTRVIIDFVKQNLGWAVIPASRLSEAEGLYNQVLYQKDKTPYRIQTKFYYSREAENSEVYSAYISHLKSFFPREQVL